MKIYAILGILLAATLLVGCVGTGDQTPPGGQDAAPVPSETTGSAGPTGDTGAASGSSQAAGQGVCALLSTGEVEQALGAGSLSAEAGSTADDCVFLYQTAAGSVPSLTIQVTSVAEANYMATLKQHLQTAGATIDGENEVAGNSIRYNLASAQCALVFTANGKVVTLGYLDILSSTGQCDSTKLKPLAEIIRQKV